MAQQDANSGKAPGRRWSWSSALVWLALAGVALITYANQLPWAYDNEVVTFPNQPPLPAQWTPWLAWHTLFPLLIPLFGLGSSDPMYIALMWRVGLPTGVALALALGIWRTSRLAAIAYFVWLALVTIGVAAIAYTLFGRPPAALCQLNCGYVTILAVRPATGIWLALVALALLWIAASARLAIWRHTHATVRQISISQALGALRSPARLAALAFTVGALVWFFGFIFVPWATQGCTGFPMNWAHFVSGSCAGLDANDALGAGWSVGVSSRVYILLGAFTGLILLVALIAVWQRGWFPPLITAVWAALATWLTSLALSGLPALLQNPPGLSVSTAPWVTGVGPAITQAGVVLVWVGVVAIYWGFAAEWRKGQRALAPNKSVSVR